MADAKTIKPKAKPFSDWIAFPRKISSMYQNGDINKSEYFTILHLRLQGNPYGKASVSLEAVRNDVFGKGTGKKGVTINYVNKILLSLRSKRLLYYKNRAGRSGTFEVSFPDFIHPDGQITDITHLYKSAYSNNEPLVINDLEAEVTAELNEESQRSEQLVNTVTKTDNYVGAKEKIRGYNNYTDTQNDIYTSDISVPNKEEKGEKSETPYASKYPTDSFKPEGYEKETARKIALEVGDHYMDWYLSLIKRNQFWALEKGYAQLREQTTPIEDKPRYLNHIVMRLLKEKIGK